MFDKSPNMSDHNNTKKLCRSQNHMYFCEKTKPVLGLDLKDIAEKWLAKLYRAVIAASGSDLDAIAIAEFVSTEDSTAELIQEMEPEAETESEVVDTVSSTASLENQPETMMETAPEREYLYNGIILF